MSASTNGQQKPAGKAESAAVGSVPKPPQFATKEQEREFLKFRLAQAFRIFGQTACKWCEFIEAQWLHAAGKLGYDEGVAGHITVRVSDPRSASSRRAPASACPARSP